MEFRYQHVAEELKKNIRQGKYPVGARIPGEDRLASELKVSRATVKSAVKVLEKEGILECRPSIGSFVLKNPAAGKTIAYLAPNLSDPFHAELTRELSLLVTASGNSLTVAEAGMNYDSKPGLVEEVKNLHRNGADAFIICSRFERDIRQIEKLDGIKTVWLLPESIPENLELDMVDINHEAGIFLLMEHLVSLGVKTVGYASARGIGIEHDKRYHAFLKFLKNHNELESCECWQQHSPLEGEAGGKNIFEQYLKAEKLPEAIVCYDDWTAIGVIRKALEAGINISEQLKVTGFDNLMLSKYFQIPLTTINCKLPQYAAKAIDILSRKIDIVDKKAEQHIIDGELILRKSTI